jgi:hypothetical protein
LLKLTIPSSVVWLDSGAFSSSPNLKAIYFEGDAPIIGQSLFVSWCEQKGTLCQQNGTSVRAKGEFDLNSVVIASKRD